MQILLPGLYIESFLLKRIDTGERKNVNSWQIDSGFQCISLNNEKLHM